MAMASYGGTLGDVVVFGTASGSSAAATLSSVQGCEVIGVGSLPVRPCIIAAGDLIPPLSPPSGH